MGTISKRLQARVMTDTEPVHTRSQAVLLLQELNHPVEKIMEKYLAANLEQLFAALQEVGSLSKKSSLEKSYSSGNEAAKESDHQSPKKAVEMLNKEFLADFAQSASTFHTIFPMGERRLTEAATDLFRKYFASVQKSLQPDVGDPSASELIAALKILSTDVAQVDEILPDAGLPALALHAAEAAVRQHVARRFKGFFERLTGAIILVNSSNAVVTEGEVSGAEKLLEAVLVNAQNIILQGSLDVLGDLKELLDDKVELMVKWRALYIDLVQGGLQDLFMMLNDHFIALCTPTGTEHSKQENMSEKGSEKTSSTGLVLLLARFSIFIEQIAVPKITEEIASSFIGGGGARSYEDRPAFVPAEICRLFRATGEQLLHHYINIQARKLSMVVKKSVTTPNWIKYKEPREVRMFADLLLQEVDAMGAEVKQVLEPGTVRTHRRSDSTGSTSSSRSNTLREDRNNRTSISQKARSRLLERDVAKLFKQKVEIFTKTDYTQTSVISAVVKMCLKSFQEYVRLETFSRSGFQQIQLDTQYLRDPLRDTVDDEAVVHFLLDEVCSAAAERCLDPVPLEPAILDKLIQAKRAKKAETEGSS